MKPDLRRKGQQSPERIETLRGSVNKNISEYQFAQKDLLLGPPAPGKGAKSGQFPVYKGVPLTRRWSEDPTEYKKQTSRIDRFGSLEIPPQTLEEAIEGARRQ